jgi:hypothetical protein
VASHVQEPFDKTLLAGKILHAAWKVKPSFYAISTKDRTINPDLERFRSEIKPSPANFPSSAITRLILEAARRPASQRPGMRAIEPNAWFIIHMFGVRRHEKMAPSIVVRRSIIPRPAVGQANEPRHQAGNHPSNTRPFGRNPPTNHPNVARKDRRALKLRAKALRVSILKEAPVRPKSSGRIGQPRLISYRKELWRDPHLRSCASLYARGQRYRSSITGHSPDSYDVRQADFLGVYRAQYGKLGEPARKFSIRIHYSRNLTVDCFQINAYLECAVDFPARSE